MAKAPAEKPRSQRERFIKAAREIGTDEDEERFEQRLKAVAGANSTSGAKGPKSEKPKKK